MLRANVLVMHSPRPGQTGTGTVSAMQSTARITGTAGIAAFIWLLAALMGAGPVTGQPAPAQVITDTPQYCLQLFDRVSEMVRVAPAPPPEEVMHLSTEGQRMCDQGQTRGGILRLRRAIMLMIHWGDGP